MTPTERRRPVTRRRRLAHLGVGGVLAAVAGAQAGAVIASAGATDPPAPEAAPTTIVAAVAEPAPPHPRPIPHRASRSHPRHPVVAVTHAPPRPVAAATSGALPAVWLRVAGCESTLHWDDDTGNGFEGGLQFAPSTWLAYGGGSYAAHAYEATPREQIRIGERVLRGQGVRAWPVCGPEAGLTPADAYLPV